MSLFSGVCHSTARLDGKIAVVTGCNTGIGKETVMDFYKRGARVIMACRSLEKAESAKKDIIEKCKEIGRIGELVVIKLDLSSLKSVRECAKHLLDTEKNINILVNNAGVMMCPQGKTEDGFETQFGTNHLGHFLLTLLLLPKIKNSTPARIVTVASLAHEVGKIDFEDLNFEKSRQYDAVSAYGQSKLANILFSKELSRKLKEHKISGINTYSLHPGVVATELSRHVDKTVFPGASWLWNNVGTIFMKTPWQGAQTSIYCSVDEECSNETGLYYSDCKKASPSFHAENDEDAKKLWKESARLVDLGDFDPFSAADSGVKTSNSGVWCCDTPHPK